MTNRRRIPLEPQPIAPHMCTLDRRLGILWRMPFFSGVAAEDIAAINGQFHERCVLPGNQADTVVQWRATARAGRLFGHAVREATTIQRVASQLLQPSVDLVAREWVVEALNQARDRHTALGTWAVAIDRLAGAVGDAKDAVVGKFTQRLSCAPDIAEDPLVDLTYTSDHVGILVKKQDQV